MTRLKLNRLTGTLLAGILLTGALGHMVFDRVRLLQSGREIVLPIVPVDPRDLFRGDFTRMSYGEVSRPDKALTGPLENHAGPVFVTLERRGDIWKPIAVDKSQPVATGRDTVVLLGRLQRYGGNIRYGLERYYVPEGTGSRIEEMARKGTLSAIVAVDAAGKSAIKGLQFEGRRVHEERPL